MGHMSVISVFLSMVTDGSVHGGVIGPATEPVLKTVRAARRGDRHLTRSANLESQPVGDRHRLESDWARERCGSRPRLSSKDA